MSRNYKKEKVGRVSVATSLFLDTLLALFPFFGDFFLYVLSLGLQKERQKNSLFFVWRLWGDYSIDDRPESLKCQKTYPKKNESYYSFAK